MAEHERRDQRGEEPRVQLGEGADGDSQTGEDELDSKPGRGEQAAFAERVPAGEPQHDREQSVVDDDEDDRGEQAGQGKRGVAGCADGSRDRPGTESAEHVVREVEAPDVPGSLVARPQWHVQGDDERDEQHRRQDEGARDDERGTRVEAVIPADRDAKARGQGREREEQRKGHPLGPRRRAPDRRCGGGGERSEAGGGGIGGCAPRQPTETTRVPPGSLRTRWEAAQLPHVVKSTPSTRAVRQDTADNRQHDQAPAP